MDSRELLNVIDVLNKVAASGLDRDAVCDLVVARAAELTNASAAVVELAEGDEMVYHKASGSAAANIGLRLKRDSSLSGLCVEVAAPLKSDDTQSDPRVNAEACRRVGAASMVCVPLFDGTRAVGVLKVIGSQPYAFSDAHINLLALLANVIGSTMANAERFSEAEHQSRHDPMTGMGNRRAYDLELEREFSQAQRQKQPLTLAILDLDGLKQINDTYGHATGDDVLLRVSKSICQSVRAMKLCFRIGGDEFAILLPETPLQDAGAIIERVQRAVNGLEAGVTISAGWESSNGFASAYELHVAADNKLYDAKEARRRRAGAS